MSTDNKMMESPQTQPAEEKPRYRVTPRYGMWHENGKWVLQISLPGVSKEQIQMKTLEDFFQLRATRDDILYSLDLDFNFKVEKDKTHAEYKEGLLKIEFTKYDPLQHAFEVKIE